MNPTIVQRTEDDGVMKFTVNRFNTSFANAIRRIILSEINCFAFITSPYEKNKCNITINTCRLNNEIIKQRLSSIPIHIKDKDFPIADYILEVDVKNDSDVIKIVTTEDFKIKNIHTGQYISQRQIHSIFPPNAISGDYIDFVRLRPKISDDIEGEHIKLECEFGVSSSGEDGTFNVVSCCTYGTTPDPITIDSKWNLKRQQLLSEGVTPEEIEYAKLDWYNLDAHRYYIKDSYDFTIETIGIYENTELVKMACLIMIKKFEKLAEALQTNPDLIAELKETTIDMCFEIILKNEDYTLGKALEFILYEKFFNRGYLSYCGFRKPHPHIDISIIRIGLEIRSEPRKSKGGGAAAAAAEDFEVSEEAETKADFDADADADAELSTQSGGAGETEHISNRNKEKVLSIMLDATRYGVEVFTRLLEEFK